MRLFNVSTEYAIKLLICLAHRSKPLPASALSREVGVSTRYLLSVCAKLRDAGLIKASHGVNGGFSLGKDATEISIMDVIKAMGCHSTPHSLSLGSEFQKLRCFCQDVRSSIDDSLTSTTIADLL